MIYTSERRTAVVKLCSQTVSDRIILFFPKYPSKQNVGNVDRSTANSIKFNQVYRQFDSICDYFDMQ